VQVQIGEVVGRARESLTVRSTGLDEMRMFKLTHLSNPRNHPVLDLVAEKVGRPPRIRFADRHLRAARRLSLY
jgi:hypothetical protein